MPETETDPLSLRLLKEAKRIDEGKKKKKKKRKSFSHKYGHFLIPPPSSSQGKAFQISFSRVQWP